MIQSMTGFESGDEAVNGFNQEVKIIDACRGEIVFEWIGENKVDTLNEDEFDALFKKKRGKRNVKRTHIKKD